MKFPSVYYTSVLALLAVHATGAVTSYNDSPTSSDVITTSYTPPQPSSSYGASPTTPGYPVTSGYPGPVQVLWGQCGGYYYYGTTICPPGAYCRHFSDWYSQCNPLGN